MTNHETILIFDFGSQYTQLIARRVRELNVYCEIHPFQNAEKAISTVGNVRGIILSGSPSSVLDKDSPRLDISKIKGNKPLLGICYGAQLLSHTQGGDVRPSNTREYGRAKLSVVKKSSALLKGFKSESQVWMSHGDTIQSAPSKSEIIASTDDVKCAAFEIPSEQTFGIQFHPEVTHTEFGSQLLRNFLIDICGCLGNWTPAAFVKETIRSIQDMVGQDKVILGLSGGVDSTVAGVLLREAIGPNLHSIFIDNGLLRKDEFKTVLENYKSLRLNVTGVESGAAFMQSLKGVTDPELKRKAIGKTFIEEFDKAAHRIADVTWLAQGTIYPDVIESASVKGPSATIKSHHNVGGLPDKMKLKIVEPLRALFKDEVRRVGRELGIPDSFLDRHPFPGPGLAVRILGEITEEKVRILQEADDIFISGLKSFGIYKDVWQAGVIFLPVQSVGVMGDERTYENAVCLRAVNSTDGMTADWSRLPYDFLAKVSNEIINKVKGVNRVVYDISSKPPATIEWE